MYSEAAGSSGNSRSGRAALSCEVGKPPRRRRVGREIFQARRIAESLQQRAEVAPIALAFAGEPEVPDGDRRPTRA